MFTHNYTQAELDRFPSPEPDDEDDGLDDDEPEVAMSFEKDIKPWLSWLPPEEQDIIELSVVLRKHQKEIGELLGLRQNSVSYRYSKAIKRLRFARRWPLTPELEEAVLTMPELEEVGRRVLRAALKLDSQTQIAIDLGLSMSSARYTVLRAMGKVLEASRTKPEYDPYAQAIRMILTEKAWKYRRNLAWSQAKRNQARARAA